MLMSQQSTEEQRYMQQLHSEQSAFESLIRENAVKSLDVCVRANRRFLVAALADTE